MNASGSGGKFVDVDQGTAGPEMENGGESVWQNENGEPLYLLGGN